ncbi:MAG: heme o synthase [Bacteroidetes bacterium]|nr:heme o synthase [Bacteroidota bacterium]
MQAHQQNISLTQKSIWSAKVSDYVLLFKVRLTTLVVFSTFIGYVISSPASWMALLPLLIGGFLTVASANSLNQIIERNTDKLMLRTLNRPLATNRMSVGEALIASLVTGFGGVLLLGTYLNHVSAILALIGLLIYAFAYTPLKKVSEISVWVGAISGAIPPMVGVAAATGEITAVAWILFALQFVWQFPHFYSIAWILFDDYKRAGLRLMPFGRRKDKVSAWQIFGLSFLLIPMAFLPLILNGTFIFSIALSLIAGVYVVYRSWNLAKGLDDKAGKKLMFASFIYLPVMLLGFLIDSMI